MSELRKIIVNATSEMLDEPDENGIYKTGRFYNRLEKEVTEHFEQPYIAPSPYLELMLETVKNSANVHPELQKVIAKFLDYQSTPVMFTKEIKSKLFGKDI